MKRTSLAFAAFAAVAATLAMAGSAQAGTLNAGGTISTSGTTAMLSPHAYGTRVHNQFDSFNIVNSSGALLFQGTLESSVFQNSAGQLTFDLQIVSSEAGLNGVVGSIGRNGFGGWDTDVDWRLDAMGLKNPSQADRSPNGEKIDWSGPWNGTPGIFSGESSRMLFASTDAMAFAPNSAIARITLTTGEFVDIEVASPIPAPGALALLGLSGCLAGSRRRRRA